MSNVFHKITALDLYLTLIYNVGMLNIQEIRRNLRKYTSQDIDKFKYFHKTGKGGYAEHDLFLGITVPNIRKVAKEIYDKITFEQVQELLISKYHEERLCAVIVLVLKMKKANDDQKTGIVEFYLNNAENINGWDLVDLSAPYILGEYIFKNNEKSDLLYKLAKDENMWTKRISIVANHTLIKNGEYSHMLNLAKIHLDTKHDLIQKAVGWMLREVGKRDYMVEYNFLKENYTNMPRTMLRYSIEKFEEEVRQKFLKGEI